MYISQNGIDFMASFEGLSLTAYKALPTEKYWTIGYGHYGADVTQGMTITKAQADTMFSNDLVGYCNAVTNSVHVTVTQAQYDMMVSLCYNIGTGGFRGSSVVTYINQGKIQMAADSFLKWNKSGGQVIQGLVRRRSAERQIFLNGYSGAITPTTPPSTEPPPLDPSESDKSIISNDNEALLMKLLLCDALNGWKNV